MQIFLQRLEGRSCLVVIKPPLIDRGADNADKNRVSKASRASILHETSTDHFGDGVTQGRLVFAGQHALVIVTLAIQELGLLQVLHRSSARL